MSKKQTKESHFIPSEFPAVTQYENEFVSEWNKNTAEAVGELLKYLAKTTASAVFLFHSFTKVFSYSVTAGKGEGMK